MRAAVLHYLPTRRTTPVINEYSAEAERLLEKNQFYKGEADRSPPQMQCVAQTYSNVSVVDIMKSFSAARHRSPFDPPIILSIGRSQLLYKSAVVYAFPKKAILILNKDFKSQRCGGKKRAPLTSWEMSWRTGRFFAVFWRDRHSNQNCLRVGRAGVSRRVRYLNSFYSATGQPAWESVIFSMTTTVSIHFFSFLIRRSGIWYLNSHKLLDF